MGGGEVDPMKPGQPFIVIHPPTSRKGWIVTLAGAASLLSSLGLAGWVLGKWAYMRHEDGIASAVKLAQQATESSIAMSESLHGLHQSFQSLDSRVGRIESAIMRVPQGQALRSRIPDAAPATGVVPATMRDEE